MANSVPPLTTRAPVYISVNLDVQLSHVRDILSSITGTSFTSPLKTGSDHYPALLEVFQKMGCVFRLKEKPKIEFVLYNLVTCCDSIPDSYRTEFFKAICQGFKSDVTKSDVVIRLEYIGMLFVCLFVFLFFCLFVCLFVILFVCVCVYLFVCCCCCCC